MRASCGDHYSLYFRISNGISDAKYNLIREVYPKINCQVDGVYDIVRELPQLGLWLDLAEFFQTNRINSTERFEWGSFQIVFEDSEACLSTYRKFINGVPSKYIICIENAIVTPRKDKRANLIRRFFGVECVCHSSVYLNILSGTTELKINDLVERQKSRIEKALGAEMSALLLILMN